MAGLERSRAVVLALSCALLTLALGTGCASSKPAREPLPPRALAAPPPAQPPPSEEPVATPKPETVVVLDPGAPEGSAPAPRSKTLVDAAAKEKERRRSAPAPVAVINDKNLADWAKDQKLTIASPANAGAPAEESAAGPTAGGHDEAWWRQRGLEIRKKWRDAADSIEKLEGQAAELRRRFYAEDDPYRRDSEIKPEWDRVLAELEAARHEVEEGPKQVEAFLDEGRRAGALPGWLREGVDLEPTPVLPKTETVEPGEPVVLGSEQPPP
jgi:hypothetical protein